MCMKLKVHLQFLGMVPLLTGADRMQDRPWTLCFSFSPSSLHSSFRSFSLSLFLFLSRSLPLRPGPLAALHRCLLYVMAPGRRHLNRYFLASSYAARFRKILLNSC